MSKREPAIFRAEDANTLHESTCRSARDCGLATKHGLRPSRAREAASEHSAFEQCRDTLDFRHQYSLLTCAQLAITD